MASKYKIVEQKHTVKRENTICDVFNQQQQTKGRKIYCISVITITYD